MLLPSEIREAIQESRTKRIAHRRGKLLARRPGSTGWARRNEALAAIDKACGGKINIRFGTKGWATLIHATWAIFRLTPSCTQGAKSSSSDAWERNLPDMRK